MAVAGERAALEAAAHGMQDVPLMAAAPKADVRRLATEGTIRHFRRGTYLFHQGDDAPDVLFLVDGLVEVSSLSSGGQRQLHTRLDRPQFFGELGVLGDMARTATAVALADSTI